MMKILGMVAENFKKIRVVEITPKGKVIQITGKNGQGKTSVLDAIWAALEGAKAIPEKPVRKGAAQARIKLDLGDLVVTRTIAPGGTHALIVENKAGVKLSSPQGVLDKMLGDLSFDPCAFIEMKPKQQIEELRKVAKIEFDVDAAATANKADYDERTVVNRDLERLKVEVASITVQEGLPKEKIDEAAIQNELAEVDRVNAAAREAERAKAQKWANVQDLRRLQSETQQEIDRRTVQQDEIEKQIEQLKQQWKAGEQELIKLESAKHECGKSIEAAELECEAMPTPAFVEVAAVSAKLQQAQLANREIAKRAHRDDLQAQLNEKRRQADQLTRNIEDREEKKRMAVQQAKMPIEGLTFDEEQVLYHGIPLEQLGEGEQIRISASIAMAANPELRVIRIMRGESMDEDALAILAMMAEQHDFQIWMARVDSSGKVGIIMEDGSVKAEAE
jgi:DNA repair exonuclease SbcCD ATPase subunit